MPIGIIALLEAGCTQVWLSENRSLLGVETEDDPDQVEATRLLFKPARVFRYGTNQDRNRHAMTGRVE